MPQHLSLFAINLPVMIAPSVSALFPSLLAGRVALLAAAQSVTELGPLRHLELLARRDEVMLVTLLFLLLGIMVLRSVAVMAWSEFPHAASGLEWAGLMVGGIAIVNLVSLFFFDVALPVVRLHTPRILRDLMVALGYIFICFWLLSRGGVSLSGIVTTSAVIA